MATTADCEATIDFDTAIGLLLAAAAPLGQEQVGLGAGSGRRLAESVTARIDGPRRDCAAMDGYALREQDVASGLRRFRSIGRIYAGESSDAALGSGDAMRVMTGASLPAGADRVVMVEDCEIDGDTVIIEARPGTKPHVRKQGSDFRQDDILLDAGQLLSPAALVAAAAADRDDFCVWRRPRVHIIVTGDELVTPGTAFATPGAIPDSLSPAIAALCSTWGGEVVSRARLSDDPSAILDNCGEAANRADLIVIVGGASHGDRDFARSALRPLGLKLLFADLAIRPGKPTWAGKTGPTMVLGLPGNPTAALTVARLFLVPLLVVLGGGDAADALDWRMTPLAEALGENGSREAFLSSDTRAGQVHVGGKQEASAQASLGRRNTLVRRPPGAPAIAAGTLVPSLAI